MERQRGTRCFPAADESAHPLKLQKLLETLNGTSLDFKRQLADLSVAYDSHVSLLRNALASALCVTNEVEAQKLTSRDVTPPKHRLDAELTVPGDVDVADGSQHFASAMDDDVCQTGGGHPSDPDGTADGQPLPPSLREDAALTMIGDVVATQTQTDSQRAEDLLHEWWTRKGSTHHHSELGSSGPLDNMLRVETAMRGETPMMLRGETPMDHVGSFARDEGRRLVLAPNGVARFTWDVLSLFVIAYDMMSLPLILAFDVDERAFSVVGYLTCSFWTVDIGVQCCSGYETEGYIEMRQRVIAKRYLKSFLIIDVIVMCADWITSISGSTGRFVSMARMGKVIRVVRLVRCVKAFRVVKLIAIIENMTDFVFSDLLCVWIGITKALIGLVMITHFVACGWYAIGASHIDSVSWVDPLDDMHVSTFYRYFISFHWAMAQYTPAANNYHPSNVYERVFACVVLLLGIAVFSSVLGSITSLLTHYRAALQQQVVHEEKMRKYLTFNRVHLALGHRISAFIRHRRNKDRSLVITEVAYLKLIPETLAMDLQLEVFLPSIRRHPVIDQILRMHHAFFLFELCHQGIKEYAFGKDEEVFCFGSEAKHMIIAKEGTFRYWRQAGPSEVGRARSAPTVFGGSSECHWICEVSLWCQWKHHGRLEAFTNCIGLTLSCGDFRDIVCLHPTILSPLKNYAIAFAEFLSNYLQSPLQNDMVDDCFGKLDVVQELALDAFDTVLQEALRCDRVTTPADMALHSFKSRHMEVKPRPRCCWCGPVLPTSST